LNEFSIQKNRLIREPIEQKREKEPRAVTPLGLATAHHHPFVQLYYALEARRSSLAEPIVIQFVSPSVKAGVSTVASGYARVAAAGRPTPVLFVDATCRGLRHGCAASDAPTLVEAFERGLSRGEATIPALNAENLYWARLCEHPNSLLALGLDRLQDLIGSITTRHQLVVLDSGSIERPEAATLARFCDASLLVIEAGATTQSQIEIARQRVQQFGGEVIGLVLNRERRVLFAKRAQLPEQQVR
jgi:Mrp family chromosome partitioning ATPase